jgi:eukaryotic-like serine/threonine-protein kinase
MTGSDRVVITNGRTVVATISDPLPSLTREDAVSRSAAVPSVRVGPHTASRADKSHTLSPEMMAEAAWRLGWLGLLYAATTILGYYGRRILIGLSTPEGITPRFEDWFGLGSVALGIAMYVVSRRGLLSLPRLLDAGLVFEVLATFCIAMVEFWRPVPSDFQFMFLPIECAWIVSFPLVVPNTPRKILVSSLLAASTGPAAVVIASLANGRGIDRPLAFAAYFLTSTYLCAVAAYAVARIVHRFNVRLTHAREIGSYELIERIGEGGMGEVWRARHRLLARPAAIKLIRADVLGSNVRTRDAIIKRFEREAQDTATLGSTHTIDVYDFGVTEEGDFYYVMELLRGITLERHVQDFGPIEPARLVYLLRQVCHSLSEAHSRGLIHRDIKPANIFVCRLGPDDDFVKVLDFGLVKHFETPIPGTMLTLEGATAGTPAYMAPEVALGKSDVDGRSDIYSLGCVAYYLLTGQPVFSGDTPVATVLAHVQNEPVPPSERSELEVPPALDQLILECLAKDPAGRPATAAEVGERLAATVQADAWTQQNAHAWWELHRLRLLESAPPKAETVSPDDESARAHGRRRLCHPRFERTPPG